MFIPRSNAVRDEAINWSQYAQLEAEGGLPAIYDYVNAIEESDKEQTLYPRFKFHDDAIGAILERA